MHINVYYVCKYIYIYIYNYIVYICIYSYTQDTGILCIYAFFLDIICQKQMASTSHRQRGYTPFGATLEAWHPATKLRRK